MPSVSTSMTCAPCALQPLDHLLEQIAPDLGDARGGFEIGKVALRKAEVAVKAVDQNLESVLQGVEVAPLRARPSPRACRSSPRSRKVRRSVSRWRKIWS